MKRTRRENAFTPKVNTAFTRDAHGRQRCILLMDSYCRWGGMGIVMCLLYKHRPLRIGTYISDDSVLLVLI